MTETEGRIDIGGGHSIRFVRYGDDPRAAIEDYHKRPDGSDCQGFVTFEGSTWAKEFKENPLPTWKVVQWEPLTLSPSLLCRSCDDHGFIENGKWRKA